MSADIDKAVEEIIEKVDELGSPEKMSKEEYSDFLGALLDDLQMRKEATDQKLEDEEG